MNRRRFIKYAVGTAAIVGGSALGLDYFLKLNPLSQTGGPTIITVTAPSIENIEWTPTRVQNSKVYDGRVAFDVKNVNQLSPDVKLDFQPLIPEQYPKAAFPAEDPRTYSLKPVSTVAETNTASFSQDITDLKGGKQYRALATIKEPTGREVLDYKDTPYVREFEKFASKDVTVGVFYGTWWTYDRWHRYQLTPTPILGNYDSGDMFAINRHIDMLTDFGGNAFLSYLDDEARTDYNTSLLFDSPLIDDVQIGLFYNVAWRLIRQNGEVNLNDSGIKNAFTSDLKYLAEKYFTRKSYFKTNGMPALYLYHAYVFSGDVEQRIKEIRESIRKETGLDFFLIGNTVTWRSPRSSWIRPYDAITGPFTNAYGEEGDNFPGSVEDNEGSLRHLYQVWSSYARELGVHFIPTAMPGFVSIRPSEKNKPVLSKSTKRFADQLKIGMDFLDDEIRCLFVTSWNDYEENTDIEPTVQEGYSYLKILRDAISS